MSFGQLFVLIVTLGAWALMIATRSCFPLLARIPRRRAPIARTPKRAPALSATPVCSARTLPDDVHPRTANLYTISDLPLFWFLSTTRDLHGTFARGHRALCLAYEVPEDWADDQARRHAAHAGWIERGETPFPLDFCVNFPQERGVFAFLQVHAFLAEAYRPSAERRSILRTIMGTYDLQRQTVLDLDIEFFSRVYGADAERAFKAEELERRWGMPSEQERSLAWHAWHDVSRLDEE